MEISNEEQLLNPSLRAKVIQDIEQSTDIKRIKTEHRKRHECYTSRTREWVLRDIQNEFSKSTAEAVAKRTPNLDIVKKIIDKKARVYKEAPERDSKLVSAFCDEIGFNEFMKTGI